METIIICITIVIVVGILCYSCIKCYKIENQDDDRFESLRQRVSWLDAEVYEAEQKMRNINRVLDRVDHSLAQCLQKKK